MSDKSVGWNISDRMRLDVMHDIFRKTFGGDGSDQDALAFLPLVGDRVPTNFATDHEILDILESTLIEQGLYTQEEANDACKNLVANGYARAGTAHARADSIGAALQWFVGMPQMHEVVAILLTVQNKVLNTRLENR